MTFIAFFLRGLQQFFMRHRFWQLSYCKSTPLWLLFHWRLSKIFPLIFANKYPWKLPDWRTTKVTSPTKLCLRNLRWTSTIFGGFQFIVMKLFHFIWRKWQLKIALQDHLKEASASLDTPLEHLIKILQDGTRTSNFNDRALATLDNGELAIFSVSTKKGHIVSYICNNGEKGAHSVPRIARNRST